MRDTGGQTKISRIEQWRHGRDPIAIIVAYHGSLTPAKFRIPLEPDASYPIFTLFRT
jgi:hypothetical protein